MFRYRSQTLNSEYESLKSSIRHADSIKSKLLVNEDRSDANSIKKMADEYSSMHKDIKKRLRTLKHFYTKQLPSKSVGFNVKFYFFPPVTTLDRFMRFDMTMFCFAERERRGAG